MWSKSDNFHLQTKNPYISAARKISSRADYWAVIRRVIPRCSFAKLQLQHLFTCKCLCWWCFHHGANHSAAEAAMFFCVLPCSGMKSKACTPLILNPQNLLMFLYWSLGVRTDFYFYEDLKNKSLKLILCWILIIYFQLFHLTQFISITCMKKIIVHLGMLMCLLMTEGWLYLEFLQ